MNRVSRYLAPIVALAMLAGCGVSQSIENAGVEVTRFHARVDAGKWQAIWKSADPEFRKEAREDDFARLIDAVRRKLGKVKSTKQVGWNSNATSAGSYVTLSMQTMFERGSGSEEFVYRKVGDQRLALAGYTIESKQMMLN